MIRHPIQELRLDSVSLQTEHGSVMNEVSLKISAGEKIWVQGEGSDYFLLRILIGLEPDLEGKYFVNNESVYDMTFEEFTPYRMNLGYGFPWGGILNNRTVRDNVMLPFQYHGYSYDQAKKVALEYMEEFGLTKHADKRPASIPGAMRKLTCLVRTLALEPQILLLDDPLTALPERAIQAFHSYIERRLKNNSDMTLVLTGPAQEYFDTKDFRILKFDNGKIEYQTSNPYTGAAA